MLTHTFRGKGRSRFEIILWATGLMGIATIFLSFTHDVSPWDVIANAVADPGGDWVLLLLLAGPFVLAIPIAATSLLARRVGRFPRPMWVAGYGLSMVAALGTLYVIGLLISEGPPSIQESIVWILPLGTLVVGAGIVIRNARWGIAHPQNTVVAMQFAYAANAALCLMAFRSEGWENGAYLTLVTLIWYVAHMAFVSLTPCTLRSR